MSKFARNHIAQNVPTHTFNEKATWRPPTWQGSTPPPELVVVRPTDTNRMFARAVLNPRIKGPKNRKDGKVREGDLRLGREKRILCYILGCVVDWANVPKGDDKGNIVVDDKGATVMLDFPGIRDSEPSDSGAIDVRDLLRSLGDDAEMDFCNFCGDNDNWLTPEAEDDRDDDQDGVVPLVKH